MTPAEELTAAADQLAARVAAATEGPWDRWRDIDHRGFYTVGDKDGVLTDSRPFTEECNPVANVYIEPDANYIAAMDPLIGTQLVLLMRASAEALRTVAPSEQRDVVYDKPGYVPHPLLLIARMINGGGE